MESKIKEISNNLFNSTYGFKEVKEAVTLQLFGNLRILLIGEGSEKSKFLKIIKQNFRHIKCIENITKQDKINKSPLLATTDPEFGRFNPMEMIAKQVNLSVDQLNSFDVIFILRDLPNKERDKQIAHDVLRGIKKKPENLAIMMSYVEKARKINPKISKEAIYEFESFYLKLRGFYSKGKIKVIAINAKNLSTMKKLSEAFARARHSSIITKEDATSAINLFKFYLCQVGYEDEE